MISFKSYASNKVDMAMFTEFKDDYVMKSETGLQFLQLDLGFLIDLRTSTSTTKT